MKRDHNRVLVVEDEPSALAALASLLCEEGYEVAMARDGEEAIRKLVEFHADLVLTDLRMPRLDGMGLINYVLTNERNPPAFVVMSAVSTPTRNLPFVAKPIDVSELLLAIERALP